MDNNVAVHLDKLIKRYPELESCVNDINDAFSLLLKAFSTERKLLVCGNGGSCADSDHIVGELMKGFMKKRPVSELVRSELNELFPEDSTYLADHLQGALPAISLSHHQALTTAFTNDVDPLMAFAQQVFGYGNSGDVLLGISTSGNAKNVLNAVKIAKLKKMKTIGLTGDQGGELKNLCDVTIRVPASITPEIQEYHLPIYHTLCIMLEEAFFSL